jgi:hypothetical protein
MKEPILILAIFLLSFTSIHKQTQFSYGDTILVLNVDGTFHFRKGWEFNCKTSYGVYTHLSKNKYLLRSQRNILATSVDLQTKAAKNEPTKFIISNKSKLDLLPSYMLQLIVNDSLILKTDATGSTKDIPENIIVKDIYVEYKLVEQMPANQVLRSQRLYFNGISRDSIYVLTTDFKNSDMTYQYLDDTVQIFPGKKQIVVSKNIALW